MSYYDDDEYVDRDYVSERKIGKPLGRGFPHLPNKQEGKELRRLMQKSGETEEQVRSKVENRRLLAAARKSPTVSTGAKRWKYEVKRRQTLIARRLGLPGWHPTVQAELAQFITNYRSRNRGWPL